MLRTILIDDEPGSLETLARIVRHYCSDVEMLGQFSDPHRGLEAILAHTPDLLLLDIEMPELSGFDIIERIKGMADPDIIFTTAHSEYAQKAFKYAAVDYLLKPVDAFELKAAVQRCQQRSTERHQQRKLLDLLLQNHKVNGHSPPTMALPTQDGYVFIKPGDILRCEADGGYTRFHLQTKETVLVSRTLHEYEELLADNHCHRIHDKHIVNLRFVKKYIKGDGGQVVLTDNSIVEVSRRRKDGFLKRMQGF